MSSANNDPVCLSAELIRRPSITPMDAGALDILKMHLAPLGFDCHRLTFTEPGTPDVDNLYARFGSSQPHFCFAGHTDVVPPGNLLDWTSNPFEPEVRDGRLYGRGAADMKCAIAAFIAATSRVLSVFGNKLPGSISLLITGDEEGPAKNGTAKVVEWLKEHEETLDACLVGEPTNVAQIGDTIKIGRRGSMNVKITVHGTQGHVAYPDLANNPVPVLLSYLKNLNDHIFDSGTKHFPPTNLEITSIDVGNKVTNLIPAKATADLNIRFNNQHTGAELSNYLESARDQVSGKNNKIDLNVSISGEAFLTPPGALTEIVSSAIIDIARIHTELSTSGGTSDARFIKDLCPVVELGLLNETAHKANENVKIDDILTITDIYERILKSFFSLS
mgnify:CR=1 FL=1